MTLEEFRKLADIWGADIGRWPEKTRASAQLLASTPQAAWILREAANLDKLLALRPAVSKERALRLVRTAALQAASQAGRHSTASWGRKLNPWLIPASLVCSGLAGSALAMMLPAHRGPEPAVLQMVIQCGSLAADVSCQ